MINVLSLIDLLQFSFNKDISDKLWLFFKEHTQLKIKKDEFTCKKVALRVEVSVSGDTNDCSHRSTSCLEYTCELKHFLFFSYW